MALPRERDAAFRSRLAFNRKSTVAPALSTAPVQMTRRPSHSRRARPWPTGSDRTPPGTELPLQHSQARRTFERFDHIRQWQESRGLKREQVAEAIGVIHPTLSHIENGKSHIPKSGLSGLPTSYRCIKPPISSITPSSRSAPS